MEKKELSWVACWKVDELKRVKVKGYEKRFSRRMHRTESESGGSG